MAFLVFLKNKENINYTLYKFFENQNDLNNSNINKDDYKIIEDLNINFNLLKFKKQIPVSYNNNSITYLDSNEIFTEKNILFNYINNTKEKINEFISSNPNHPALDIWKNYYNQLNNLNLDTITFPLNKSLEEYFNDLGLPSLNILQLP